MGLAVYVYDIEEHRRPNFRTTTLAGIAAAYAVTFDSLFAVLRDPGASLEPLPPAGTPRIAAVPDPAVPREPREGDADEVIEALIAGSEVLQLLWRYPDPKGPVGKLLAREKRLALMRAWISNDPRGVLDDEGRNRGTGA